MNWQLPYGAHPLAPFDHQVAGQSSMLRYNETTVCKPLIAREGFVYKTLPLGLKEFTPEYRGEIEVRLAEKDGFLLLYGLDVNNESIDAPCDCSFEESHAHSPDITKGHQIEKNTETINRDILGLKNVRAPQNQCMIRVLQSESYEVFPPAQGRDQGDVRAQHPSGLNPWSLKNHKRLLDKMRKSKHSQNCMHVSGFILLKNVAADFKYPCILDLKIGSRLHGDEAEQSKVESQSQKCRETTSSSIGVRLCGMQVYQKNTGTFTSYDKYHGRTLKDDTFKEALISFLHNGVRSRRELLEPIVSQLSKLINCLENVNSYRFYASSLLIIYDGEETSDSLPVSSLHTSIRDSSQRKNGINLSHQVIGYDSTRVGDKSHPISTVCDKTCHKPYLNDKESFNHSDSMPADISEKHFHSPSQEVSDGRNLGKHSVTSLVSPIPSPRPLSHQNITCEQFNSEELHLGTRKSSCEPVFNDSSDVCPPEEPIHDELQAMSEPPSVTHDQSCYSPSYRKVDVKMIDFAHTTHEGFPKDKLRHEGPDLDYINGLINLKVLFEQLMCSSQ